MNPRGGPALLLGIKRRVKNGPKPEAGFKASLLLGNHSNIMCHLAVFSPFSGNFISGRLTLFMSDGKVFFLIDVARYVDINFLDVI